MKPRVLLIGGAPMSGKSSVARVLGERHRRAVIATDDLGAAVRAVTRPAPAGEDHREYYLVRTVEQLWQEALESHRALGPAIEAVARMHADWAAPAILEGWAILPELLDGGAPRIERLWLIADRALLEARTRADVAFWSGASDEEAMIQRFVERSLRLNDHLKAQPRRLRLLELSAHEPPEAVADRIEALLR